MDPGFGALVVSLDFELRWGVFDRYPPDGGAYRRNLLGARAAIPRLLDLFEEFNIAATWATVGFLFATSRQELRDLSPPIRPSYQNPALSPYAEPIGDDEADDPLHYAPSLIAAIRDRPRQEIASHTFSHYYCLEAGQTRDAFAADLASAVAIAGRRGLPLRSIVLPRNQLNPAYADVLTGAGFSCYRGNEGSRIYRAAAGDESRQPIRRAARLLDSYVTLTGDNLTPWAAVRQPNGLFDVRSSRFLRPYSPRLRHLEPLRLRRITHGIRTAATQRAIYHLWWHPHNVGTFTDENLAFLRRVLETFADCRERHGMRSLSMAEVVDLLKR